MNTSCCTNPIRINTLLIKNRIVFPAMCTKYAAPDGGVTERMLRYYEERAKGGAGLVTIAATSVNPEDISVAVVYSTWFRTKTWIISDSAAL